MLFVAADSTVSGKHGLMVGRVDACGIGTRRRWRKMPDWCVTIRRWNFPRGWLHAELRWPQCGWQHDLDSASFWIVANESGSVQFVKVLPPPGLFLRAGQLRLATTCSPVPPRSHYGRPRQA